MRVKNCKLTRRVEGLDRARLFHEGDWKKKEPLKFTQIGSSDALSTISRSSMKKAFVITEFICAPGSYLKILASRETFVQNLDRSQ